MLSWIESFAIGFVTGGVAYLLFRGACSIVDWRYQKHKQITDACNKIDNAFEARETQREEQS